MDKTTFKHKLLLFSFGVVLALLILEIVLRLGGFIFSFYQNRSNQIDFSQGQFRILCIGESTTALGGDDSYPSQLELILNEKVGEKKFKVINKGLVSKTSQDILERLPAFIEQYQPRMIVAMLGINDRHVLSQVDTWLIKVDRIFQNLRVYRFFQLLGMHIHHKLKFREWKESQTARVTDESGKREWIELSPDAPPEITKTIRSYVMMERHEVRLQYVLENLKSEAVRQKVQKVLAELRIRQSWLLVAIGRYHRQRKDYPRAQQALGMALVQQLGNFGAFIELGRCYKDLQKYSEAIVFFYQAQQIEPKGLLPLIELRRCYEILKMDKEAYRMSREILKRDTQDFPVLPEVGDWFKEHEYYEEAEKSFIKAIEKNPYDYTLYENLAEVYTQLGEEEKADKYYSQALLKEERLVEYPPMTIHNYNNIVGLATLQGIKMICMQYPLRSIVLLKQIIRRDYSVIFVENKENFKQALEISQYSEYFSDYFGGDFGHCTRAGNRLIAENLADTILKMISGTPGEARGQGAI